MSFAEALKTEANYTTTINGAKTHGTTGDACLDLFSVAGGMRYRRPMDQQQLFTRAYIENPELAMKLLFHIRDIRGGMGERKLFRTLIRYVAVTWPGSAKKNVALIAEYGRWDDLLCLMGTKAQPDVVNAIRTQLQQDCDALARRNAGERDAHISLLAKWLPSDNTSSARTRGNARVLMQALGMMQPVYRKTITSLRTAISLTERKLTSRHVERINYEAVPAGAMLKYRGVFEKRDNERFGEYLANVQTGNKTIHVDTLFPYEILRPMFRNVDWRGIDLDNVASLDTLETLWNAQPKEIAQKNAISVVDTSGSMYDGCGAVMPALISQAMGLYCAQRCTGPFHNMLITFESTPHLVEVKGNTLVDQLRYIGTLPWGGSTNLEAVFDLILRTAVTTHCPQSELPEVLYIFSDMEFNQAIRNPNETVCENARRSFEEAGYTLPAVVFHNVNSWQMQAPVTAHTRGAALTSGASRASFTHTFDGNITPMAHMLRVLNSARYAAIHA